MVIAGRKRDLGGGFFVSRILPYAKKRALGPFVFFDHMGPLTLTENHAMDVRPHPHIGLATVTYLFEGNGYHRDTLGNKQIIKPGDINWMTAGRGIAHSERTPKEDINSGKTMHGIQIWVALPKDKEEVAPSFFHHPKETLPTLDLSKNSAIKLMIGEYKNKKSPVQTFSKTVYMDIQSQQDDILNFEFPKQEIGIYLISGSLKTNGQTLQPGEMFVYEDAKYFQLELGKNSRALMLGGEPHPEERFIWWNFVSSSKERIHQAAKDWLDQKFGHIEGETDFIPLPKDPLP